MSDTFRTIDNRPIFWRGKVHVHACEGADIHRDVRLIWTLCQRDVPANAAYLCDGEQVDCPKCLAQLETNKNAAGVIADGVVR